MKVQLLTVFVLLSSLTTNTADEVAIVTSGAAYLLDQNDKVVDHVPFYHVFDVKGESGQYLEVRHDGAILRVHRGMVHQTSQMTYLDRAAHNVVRRSFGHLSNAARQADQEDYEQAISLTRKALKAMERGIEDSTPLHAWILQYEAWLEYARGENSQAGKLLDQCDAILRAIGRESHFQAADVLNVRALVQLDEGHVEQAVQSYQKALQILVAELGTDHNDTAIVYGNLSEAHESAGDYSQAIFARTISVDISQKVLPTSATELADAYGRLGDLLRDNRQHGQALRQFGKAIQIYQQHHPDNVVEIADLRTDTIYSMTQAGDFEAAEVTCRELLDSLDQMESADAAYYRRDAIMRLGAIDYAREDYAAALKHYRDAVALADPGDYHSDDGAALESVGASLLSLDRTAEAKAAFEKALRIYAVTDGADSDTVLDLRDYIEDLDSIRNESLGGIVQVALPQGYLLDDDGSIVDSVPGLTILNWLSSNDEFHEVELNGKVYRLDNSQLHSRRSLPGYGVVQATDFRSIMKHVSQSLQALEKGESQAAQQSMHSALETCRATSGEETSLWLWLKIVEAGVQLRLQGPEVARKSLLPLEESVDSMNPNGYPIGVEFHSAMAGVLRELGDATAAAEQYAIARDMARDHYGENHAVLVSTLRSLGKALYRAGANDNATAALQEARRIADKIYPNGSPEPWEVVSEYAFALSASGQLDDAAALLEVALNQEQRPPREVHAMLVATLGKIYARLDRPADARQLLQAVVDALRGGGDSELNCPAGLLALMELGQLNVQQEEWQPAVDNLNNALTVAAAMNVDKTFETAGIHENLAKAYQAQKLPQKVAAELTAVLRIYESLGGGDSPQAAQIRSQLKDVMVYAATAESQPGGPPVYLIQMLDLTPDGQQMVVAKSECAVVDIQPNGVAVPIGTLKADKAVWSLQTANGRHQIYLPDEKRYGWVSADDVISELPRIVRKGREKLEKELGDEPEAKLEACLEAFRNARPSDGFSDVEAGISAVENSLAVIRSHYRHSNPLSGLLYGDLLMFYQAAGQYDKVATVAEEGLSSLLSAYGYFHPVTAEARFNIANHYRELGNDSKEASGLDEVLTICTRCFGPDHPRTKMQQIGYAANRVRSGHFDDAMNIYESLSASESGDAPEQVFLRAVAQLGQGGLQATRKNFFAAAKLLQGAEDDFATLGIPVPSLMAQALTIHAWCEAQDGESQKASSLLERAAELPLGPAEAPLRLSILTLQARVLAEDSEVRGTELAFQAVRFAEEAFGPDHVLLADPHQVAGRALAVSDPAQAAKHFTLARRYSVKNLAENGAYQDVARQISFVSADRQDLDEALSLAMAPGGEVAAADTATWLVNGQALLPEILAIRRQWLARISNAEDMHSFRTWRRHREQRAEIPLKLRTASTPPHIQQVVAEITAEEKLALAELPSDMATMLKQQRAWVSLEDVQNRMRPDEVLIIVRRIPEPPMWEAPAAAQLPAEARQHLYAAWIIPPVGKGDVRMTALGIEGRIRHLVDDTLKAIREAAFRLQFGESVKDAARQEQIRLKALSDQIWKPIAEKLPKGTTHLTLCLDGDLHQVPWVGLPDASEQLLIDSYTIRHLSTPRDLLNESVALETTSPTMIYGATLLDRDSSLAGFPRDRMKVMSDRTDGTSFDIERETLKDAVSIEGLLLRGLDEAEAVRGPFGRAFGGDVDAFDKSTASEFRYFSTVRPRALHIAASAFAEDPAAVERSDAFAHSESRYLIPVARSAHFNPLMRCGLLLAGFNRRDDDHHMVDGVLTGEEIISQDLRGTELVTLSVCPVSLSGADAEGNAAGIIPHAFQLAGAESVVSIAWALGEEQTTPLIQAFYENLAQGMEKAAALQKAQQQIRNESVGKGFGSVAAWAGFRLTGMGWSEPATGTANNQTTASTPLDRNDPRQQTQQILKLFKAKDIRGLLALGGQTPPEEVLESFAPGTERYDSLFGADSWRWQAVSEWNGQLPNLYYMKGRTPSNADDADTVHVEFGRTASEVFVATFRRADGGWTFDDLHSPDASDLKSPQ